MIQRWARIDCNIFENPKVEPLSKPAKLAYVAIILWCKNHDTGGVVAPSVRFRIFESATAKIRQELIDAELLLLLDDGSLFLPSFEEKQPPTDEERRAKDAKRKKAQRDKASQNVKMSQGHSRTRLARARANKTRQDKNRTKSTSRILKRQSISWPANDLTRAGAGRPRTTTTIARPTPPTRSCQPQSRPSQSMGSPGPT